MLKGAAWGWWLGAFYMMYSIFRNGSALVTVVSIADQLEGGARGPDYYIIKHAGRIVIHFLIFLYFFKANVLEYFGLTSLSKATAVSAIVGMCLAVMVALSLLAAVTS